MPMRKLKPTIAALGCALLAACAAPPSSPNAGPGPVPAGGAAAGALFSQVCVANAGDLSGAASTLATLPFTQNANTGTYYHNRLNLSFNLARGECSLVFISDDPTPAVEFQAGAEATGINADVRADFTVRAYGDQTITNVRLTQ